MYYCRDHVDCVGRYRLMFYGYKSVYRANVDGTGQREIVSDLWWKIFALSLGHNNHVCWGKYGKYQRTVLNLAPIKYAAQIVDICRRQLNISHVIKLALNFP